mmetsp:Transcript_17523/g.24102  ORF Transcript_17523/g.24102 Transcript_17523/m.24102 type:complete len:170 (+) Transcript_17523:46-555(+)
MYLNIIAIALFFLGHLPSIICLQRISHSVMLSNTLRGQKIISAVYRIKNLKSTERDDLQKSNELKRVPTQNIFTSLLQVLPILSIILSAAGISFQVFVLYPWHEELSAEFKELETAVIKLDKRLEVLDPELRDTFPELKRTTDKYTHAAKSLQAGPKISEILPFLTIEK